MKKGLGVFVVALFVLPGAALIPLAMLSESNTPAGTARGGADECRGCLRNTRMWCGALAKRATLYRRR